MYRKWGYSLLVLLASCLPHNPITPEKLPAPQLSFVDIAIITSPQKGYRGAIHLEWRFVSDNGTISHSFTLLRKLPEDSVFDVFAGSRQIPGDSSDFFDQLTGYTFPDDGFDEIGYRLVAVDTVGNAGDTSEVCIVRLASPPQPISFSPETGCISWESWIRGGVFSWCVVWMDSLSQKWTSEEKLVFTLTDEPAAFTACLPDSMTALPAATWHYALFVKANEAMSVTLGETDVQ